ncbi:MAG: purine nucleoside permease/predicted cupin superfamily sugar epimerase [Paraglaciecola sp.]|jgi:purine nucleoside permease/predicted cupin superfamily sugar epimerase
MLQKYAVIIGVLLALNLTGCSNKNKIHNNINSLPPIEIKVVVVNMFEIGEDQGDKAGEFQLFKAGLKLHSCVPFPASFHDICLNPQTGVLGIVTGMGTAKSASAIMALGLDPRFDLSHAYWLVAGIAGVDPQDASIGSAVWANYLVDGDLAHEIDARDMPHDWQSGYFPLFQQSPLPSRSTKPSSHYQDSTNGEVYRLDQQLVSWAFELTKNLALTDNAAMQTLRSQYINYPNAQKAPFVLQGDQLASSTFWHGKHLNQWANDWVNYWTKGQGNFVTSGMEDTGSYQAITYLDNAGKADRSRFLVLRTASNYSMPPSGTSALDNLKAEGDAGYAGMQASLDAAYTVGSVVVNNLVENWPRYKHALPYAEQAESRSNPNQALPQSPVQSTTADKQMSGSVHTNTAKLLTAEQIIAALDLQGHVEGGYFRQTFSADHRPAIATQNGPRVTMTSIYYLLTKASPIGHFHMNQSDIMHYFHSGDPITYYMLHPDGTLETTILGPDPTLGHQLQMLVKGGTWKASRISITGPYGYGLIGEAVSPGFNYNDMQLGLTPELLATFPQHQKLIQVLSR